MDTSKLKPFAQEARRTLMAQVSARLDQVLADQSAARREQRIEIDLDDGVKANYPKFGAALKPIKGLSDADE